MIRRDYSSVPLSSSRLSDCLELLHEALCPKVGNGTQPGVNLFLEFVGAS